MSRYITCEHEQGSDAWLADRCGRLNGSEVSAIFAKIKTGEAAARSDLRYKLVLERLTGTPESRDFTNKEMEWGHEQEPHARMALEMETGLTIRESGYTYLPDTMAGCSVDGFVEDAGRFGIAEFKCPKSRTHIGYIDGGVLPALYVPQVEHNMWITGAQFCDFMSFDPRFPEKLKCFHIRVERDQERIDAHEAAVLQFLLEVDALETSLRLRAA